MSEPMGPVVVGIDGSASLGALDLAAEEAAGRVTPLLVVHAYDPTAVRPETVAEILATAVGRVQAEHPALAVEADPVAGSPVAVLLDRAREACLLVVGHHGRARPGPSALGSVALALVQRSPVPVIVHRPIDTAGQVDLPRPVLLGLAADEPSDILVEFAFAEAALRGAALHAMYVWSQARDWDSPDLHGMVPGSPLAQAEAERLLDEALAGWAAKYPGVPVRQSVRHSLDASIALAAASRSAQLVVVGSARRAGGGRGFAGSVGTALIHRCGCSVAVVDPTAV